MGRNKLFMELDGEPLVRRVVGRASKAGFDPLFVVLGHEADLVQRALEGIAVPAGDESRLRARGEQLAARRHPGRGRDAGARGGRGPRRHAVRDTGDDRDADPTSTAEGAAPLVISDYGGVNAPPMLYDRSLFDELAVSEGQGCGKHVVKRHRHEAESVVWPVEALTDLDEPADYERVKGH